MGTYAFALISIHRVVRMSCPWERRDVPNRAHFNPLRGEGFSYLPREIANICGSISNRYSFAARNSQYEAQPLSSPDLAGRHGTLREFVASNKLEMQSYPNVTKYRVHYAYARRSVPKYTIATARGD